MCEGVAHEDAALLALREHGLGGLDAVPVLLELFLGLAQHLREALGRVGVVDAAARVLRDDGREPLERGDVVRIGLESARPRFRRSSISSDVTESSFFSRPRNRAAARSRFPPSSLRSGGGHVARRRLACVFMATPRRRLGAAIDLRSRLRCSLRGSTDVRSLCFAH